DANLVVVGARQASGTAGSDQVERAGARGVDRAADVVGSVRRRIVLVQVARDDRVLENRGARVCANTAAVAGIVAVRVGDVISDRAVDARHRSAQNYDAAATATRGVAADGRVDERQTRSGGGGADSAAIRSGSVAEEGGIDDGQCAVVDDGRA